MDRPLPPATVFDLPGQGTIALSGKDHVAFLQGLVTNDVRRLTPGTGCRAAFLTPKGKMLADLAVLAAEEEVLVDCQGELSATLEGLFRKYLVYQEVTISSRTADVAVSHLTGPGAGGLLEGLGTALPPDGPWRHAAATFRGGELRVVRASRTGAPGFDLRLAAGRAPELERALADAGASRGSAEELEEARIEAGLPRWGRELDETVLPNEAWLERDAISYAKGCYIGQETVARIRTYGHVNRKLVRLLLPEGPCAVAPGAELRHESTRVGAVTSATYSRRLGRGVALGYVKRELAEPGARLEAVGATGAVPAEVSALPGLPA